jgi:hypothetical protein
MCVIFFRKMKTKTGSFLVHWVRLAHESLFASGNRQKNDFDHLSDGLMGKLLALALMLVIVGSVVASMGWGLFLPRVYVTSLGGRVVRVTDFRGHEFPTNMWPEILKGRYDQYPPLPPH